MALVITQGEQQHGETWQAFERISQSTATAFQVLDNHTDVSFLGMGTATGAISSTRNLYALNATSTEAGVIGDAVEGMVKMILSTGTGEAGMFVQHPTQGRLPLQAMMQIDAGASGNIDVTMASATGLWIFGSDGDFLEVRFRNGTWNYIDGAGATMAAAT